MIATHGWFVLSDRLTVGSISEKNLMETRSLRVMLYSALP